MGTGIDVKLGVRAGYEFCCTHTAIIRTYEFYLLQQH